MGHERIGFLPHTKQWRVLMDQLTEYDGDPQAVKKIADQTLQAIKKIYERMPYDESVIKAIQFLATLSVSATKEDQISFLQSNGYIVSSELSNYSILANANKLITTDTGSLEINKIVRDSVMQAVIEYSKSKQQFEQVSLFSDSRQNVWEGIGSGAAFCEITRSFFAAFTSRQLRYYLERTAASTINDYSKLNAFIAGVDEHSADIADHSFETSKLMQSFAAGWYNKHAKDTIPSESDVVGFLRISFGKLREEFRREAESA